MRRNGPLHGLKVIGSNMTEVDHGEVYILYSYETPVAVLVRDTGPTGGPYVTEKVWSRTTSKHIGTWLRQHNYTIKDPRVKRTSQEEIERIAVEGRRAIANPFSRRQRRRISRRIGELVGEGYPDGRGQAGAIAYREARMRRRNPEDEDDPYKHSPDEDYPHPGKFEGETWLAVQVYDAGSESADEEVGTVEDIGWHGLYTNFEASDGSVRHVILRENDQGFVFLTEFDSAEDARAAFEEIAEEYEDFTEEAGDDEYDAD